jgi:acyl carrier protein
MSVWKSDMEVWVTIDQQSVEDLIIDLLATNLGLEPEDLRAMLESRGDGMPVDSVLAAEVLAAVEAACGVTLAPTQETAQCLQSVREFAAAVVALALERDQAAGEIA